MKKFISVLLSLAMIVSLAPSAFAAQPITSATTQTGILDEILYEDSISMDSVSGAERTTANAHVNIIVSFLNNPDGSVTIYEHHNNQLSQYHSTFPGSGILYSTYVNEDGTSRSETTFTKASRNESLPVPTLSFVSSASTRATTNYTSMESTINSPTSVRNLGYMHYRHTFMNIKFALQQVILIIHLGL